QFTSADGTQNMPHNACRIRNNPKYLLPPFLPLPLLSPLFFPLPLFPLLFFFFSSPPSFPLLSLLSPPSPPFLPSFP
ncbi:hypothetical protein ACXWRW_12145, partial [Streptococcus pyogenes]